ncbi:MAG: ABC transporter permease [Chitinophagales bacterium]
MIRNYLKTAFRQLRKNRIFSIVNIVGLSLGLSSVMTLAILVYQYLTTNSNQKEIDKIFYLKTHYEGGGEGMEVTYPLLGEILRKCPEVEAGTHIQGWYYPWLKYGEKEFQETTDFVDSAYFKVFQFPFKYGFAERALADKFSIVLSEELAEKFFGNQNPLGKTIVADDSIQLKVTGVLQHIPTNSTIRPTVVLNTALLEANVDFQSNANWYNTFANIYLRLKKNARPKELDAKMDLIVKNNYAPESKNSKVYAVPFSKITEENGAALSVIIKGAVGAGLFILLIILVNLINLNAASMHARAKEVAVRQMIGSGRKNIILQFCIENGLIVLFSLLIAWLLFSLLLLPGINGLIKDRFGEIAANFATDYPIFIFFAGIGLLLTILAASFPAWKLTAIKVVDTVKGRLNSGHYKASYMRNIFITIQFILAIILISVTIILNKQIGFMKAATLGFNKEDVAVANLDLAFRDPKSAESRFESILNELKQNPHVKSISTNSEVPTSYWQNYNSYFDPLTKKDVHLRKAVADAGYLPTYQIQFIQGKNFNDHLAASQKNGVIINESAMKAFGWTDAIGKQLVQKGVDQDMSTVIGVVKDYHYGSVQHPIEPLIHEYTGKPSLNFSYLSIRADHGFLPEVMAELEKNIRSIPSRREISYEMMSNKVDKQYALFQGILKVTNFIALLTILIAAMGMFGLTALFAKQRVKEIGIRKVLGASAFTIVKVLSRDFLIMVCIAILVASPIASYIMDNWLKDFAYRINMQWWMFALAGSLALFIAMLTVGLLAFKAAQANPVVSLRTE